MNALEKRAYAEACSLCADGVPIKVVDGFYLHDVTEHRASPEADPYAECGAAIVRAAVAAAVAAEREACAEVADEYSDMESSRNAMSVARESMALAIAEAIRARASGGNGGAS